MPSFKYENHEYKTVNKSKLSNKEKEAIKNILACLLDLIHEVYSGVTVTIIDYEDCTKKPVNSYKGHYLYFEAESDPCLSTKEDMMGRQVYDTDVISCTAEYIINPITSKILYSDYNMEQSSYGDLVDKGDFYYSPIKTGELLFKDYDNDILIDCSVFKNLMGIHFYLDDKDVRESDGVTYQGKDATWDSPAEGPDYDDSSRFKGTLNDYCTAFPECDYIVGIRKVPEGVDVCIKFDGSKKPKRKI